MKRTLISLLSLLALLTITSCQKDATGDGSQFRATMESTADGKTVLSGTALNWVSGDQVAIYGTAGCGIYQATPQTPATVATLDNVSGETGDGPFRAFYPASLTSDGATITLPAGQTYVENSINEFPMYAESATNQLAFKNLCGVLKLHLTKANTNITSITVKANAEICGDYTVSYMNDVPQLSYTGNGSKTVTMACPTAQDISDGKDFYIVLPATFDSLKSITLTTDDGRTCTKTVKSNVCINVQRSTVKTIMLNNSDMYYEPLPEGALPGLFTINQSGDFVRFSQGNLQYQASTNIWRFAENQWDFVGQHSSIYDSIGGTVSGSDNRFISSTYSGWIDLFGWGTGNNPTQHSTDFRDYQPTIDWGVNAISNGGNQPDMWRTLSISEWAYLFNRRPTITNLGTNNARFVRGRVNGVKGVILFPNVYYHPDGLPTPTDINNFDIIDWNDNLFTSSQWAEMEENGAVFLPAAGFRAGTRVIVTGNSGRYYSTTPTNSPDQSGGRFMDYGRYYLDPYSYNFRQYGQSVRLIMSIN